MCMLIVCVGGSDFVTVKDALSCRASLFCNYVAKFTLAERFSGSVCGRKQVFRRLRATT